MSRKIKPCGFCEEDTASDYVEGRNGFCIWYEVYPFNNVIAFMAQANTEDGFMMENSIDIQMNFCPVCGRRLTNV